MITQDYKFRLTSFNSFYKFHLSPVRNTGLKGLCSRFDLLDKRVKGNTLVKGVWLSCIRWICFVFCWKWKPFTTKLSDL